MAQLLLDYRFAATRFTNPDGTFPGSFTNATVTEGPGETALGRFDQAVDLGATGKARCRVSGLAFDDRRFCIRLVFQADGSVHARQNLAECTALPFALFLEKGTRANEMVLVATVGNKTGGWAGPSSRFHRTLRARQWYTVTLAYDMETAALFVDDAIVAVYAFPEGRLNVGGRPELFLGTWVDGRRNHFQGKMALFQWYKGIPEEVESRLDERRSHPEWFVTYKYEAVKRTIALGQPTGALSFDRTTGAYFQPYQRGGIMYHDSLGAAFEMHGAIYARYRRWPGQSALGYLVSDESPTTRAGGRKSVFSRGAIYWSPRTGAVPVQDQIYLDYEHLGESRFLGFPTRAARPVPGGLEQVFEGGRMYHRTGEPTAYEVHGAILAKYIATGGVRKWGFPVTNESDINKNGRIIGKFSEFEHATIYWSGRTGAHEVHGDIRKKYQDLNGPLGDLGFPTSDEVDIPRYAGAGRMNTFESGSLLWYGSWSSMIMARPFTIFLGRIHSRESEGFLMGQNDLYCYVKVKDGGRTLYNKRHPRSGDWGGRNIKDVNLTIPVTIVPNKVNQRITFSVDIWDADPGKDDHLGKYTKELNAANGWGLRENNGVYRVGEFSKIRSLTWSVKPKIDPKTLSETEKFWGVANKGTKTITWSQHASAFRDVDSETEWWDVTDWLDKAFYQLVVEDLASSGNCFGMALEAIYARKQSSIFSLPINRFTNWQSVRKEFNIKHCYQVGAGPIWWFLGEFVTGNTHDPKDVFLRTRREFERGNHPVLCLSQNYDFSGAPHCILPVAWDSSRKPWRITICDPNFPNQLKELTVDPDRNKFEYRGSKTYRGGEWSGGRLHYMPFSKLCTAPRTPVWDAILLILTGTIIILGDDAQTESITDARGNDLDAFGARATQVLQAGRRLDEFFVGFKGYDHPRARPLSGLTIRPVRPTIGVVRPGVLRPRRSGKGTVAGEILLRSEQYYAQNQDPGTAHLAHMPVAALVSDRRIRPLAEVLRRQPTIRHAIGDRLLHHVVNDERVMAALPSAVADHLTQLASVNAPRDYRHRIVGVRSGTLGYVLKHGLSECRVTAPLRSGDRHGFDVNNLGTNTATLGVSSSSGKSLRLEMVSKLGVTRDRVQIILDRVPVETARPLEVNMKPGLGGLEFVTPGLRLTVPVTLNAVIGGRPIKRNFLLPVHRGARLKVTTALFENALNVSRIDRLFGPVRGAERIRGR